MPGSSSYTPDEVAQILKVSRFTIYEMIKRGELPAYRVGRQVRVDQSDLDQYKQQAKGINNNAGQLIANPAPLVASAQEGIILCGQDPILDIITRHLEQQFPHLSFLRRHVGSIAGLLALYQGAANLATAHLWDGDTDEYNLPYIRHMLPGHKTLVYNLVFRTAGFYVAKGNPKRIRTWEDLFRPELRFVNRECGSGARVLLDEKVSRLNLNQRNIPGYNTIVTSHLAVASTVARGDADAGIGIQKVASQVPEIDFVPLQQERYDLVIREEDAGLPHFQALLHLLQSRSFQAEIQALGGYDVSQMGQPLSMRPHRSER